MTILSYPFHGNDPFRSFLRWWLFLFYFLLIDLPYWTMWLIFLIVLLSSTLSPWRRITLQFFSVMYICYAVVWEQGSCSLMCGSDACCLPSLSTSCWQDRHTWQDLWLILFISATTHCHLFGWRLLLTVSLTHAQFSDALRWSKRFILK